MAEKMFDFPQTKGTFQVRGIVHGVDKNNFYVEKKTKSGMDFRAINFGIEYDKNKSVYVDISGMTKDKVYMSRRNKETNKTETKPVAWNDRNNNNGDYRIIGTNLGIRKITDENGIVSNDKVTLVEYDACKYISEALNDDMSVFTKGNLDYSSYNNKNGDIIRRTKLVPTQISLCKNDIDFDDENYNVTHEFTQTIVFMGINQEIVDDKSTGRFIIEAKIVNYNSIENAEFIVDNKVLANQMRKVLKPYNAIEVFGSIEVSMNVSVVEEEDCWGEPNKMERINSPIKREFIVRGAKPSTIDRETYNEDDMNAALKKISASKNAENKFDGNKASEENTSDWGESSADDSEDDPW